MRAGSEPSAAGAAGLGAADPSRAADAPRFHLLDVLRGLAALSVVLWHWQHFFKPFNPRGLFLIRDRQPAFGALRLFYTHGDAAVALFFCLSGFIFFWLYADRIRGRQIRPGRFFVLRASRLYPLHAATLLLVAVGQWLFVRDVGAPFVYGFNDGFHFALQAGMMSAWGAQQGTSFNGPAWSVSVEALLYVVFFLFALVAGRRVVWLAVAAGLAMVAPDTLVVQGLRGFFMGGLVHAGYGALGATGRRRVVWWLLPGVAFLWAVTAGVVHHAVWATTLAQLVSRAPWVLGNWSVLVLFPSTVLVVALADERWGRVGARLRWIGDISYSSYLIHFPLQLAVSLWVLRHGSDWRIFYRATTLISFVAALLVVSLASHHAFERPLQRYLRRRMIPAASL